MGTVFTLSATAVSESKAGPALEAALDEIARIESVLSEWRADSEISKVNAAAGKHPVRVGPDTIAVVEAGLKVSKWSQGAFDMSWAALRGLYLFQPGARKVPTQAQIAARLPLIDYRNVILDRAESTVYLKREGMKIGTGGIGKGYALDRAGSLLREAGIENYMFFGGGQVHTHGTRGGRPWRVGVQHPRAPTYFGYLELKDGSLSTSGDYEHAFVVDGLRWHHVLDPRTGKPVRHTSSVTVVTDSGLYADALSTAVFVLGHERALQMKHSAPVPFDAVIVDSSMLVIEAPKPKSRFVPTLKLHNGRLPAR